MDMKFNSDNIPDFGSIVMTNNNGDIREYMLLSVDIPKLELITNAANGSVAFICDKNFCLYKLNNAWQKVGESNG